MDREKPRKKRTQKKQGKSKSENPTTFEEATQTKEWKQAIEEEVVALENQRTWKVAKLLKEKTAIETRWVFATKENGRKKARLVVKEFQKKRQISKYMPL